MCICFLFSLLDLWDSLVVAIGSNTTTLKFDEIIQSLLSEVMRNKNMESQNRDALSVLRWSQNMNKNNSSSGISKSRGRSKSLGKHVNVCWKFGNEGHYKKYSRSKAPEKRKGYDDYRSTEVKTTLVKGGMFIWLLLQVHM